MTAAASVTNDDHRRVYRDRTYDVRDCCHNDRDDGESRDGSRRRRRNQPAYDGAPFDADGYCTYHPRMRLYRRRHAGADAAEYRGEDAGCDRPSDWRVCRKFCPECVVDGEEEGGAGGFDRAKTKATAPPPPPPPPPPLGHSKRGSINNCVDDAATRVRERVPRSTERALRESLDRLERLESRYDAMTASAASVLMASNSKSSGSDAYGSLSERSTSFRSTADSSSLPRSEDYGRRCPEDPSASSFHSRKADEGAERSRSPSWSPTRRSSRSFSPQPLSSSSVRSDRRGGKVRSTSSRNDAPSERLFTHIPSYPRSSANRTDPLSVVPSTTSSRPDRRNHRSSPSLPPPAHHADASLFASSSTLPTAASAKSEMSSLTRDTSTSLASRSRSQSMRGSSGGNQCRGRRGSEGEPCVLDPVEEATACSSVLVPRSVSVPRDRVVLSNLPSSRRSCVPRDVEPYNEEEGSGDGGGARHSERGRRSERDRGRARGGDYDSRLERSIVISHGDVDDGGSVSYRPSTITRSTSSDSSSVQCSDATALSVQGDVDPEGYCVHHPNVQLLRQRDGGTTWVVRRKVCSECLRDGSCPALVVTDPSVDGSGSSVISADESRIYEVAGAEDGGSVSSYGLGGGSHSSESGGEAAKSSINAFSLRALQTPEEIEEEEAERRLKRRLAARAYHFPGNTWCEDWMQYMSNTHTVLGLFFHHPLHPLRYQERLVILFGSIAIGVTISNVIYLNFINNSIDPDEDVMSINSNHTKYTGIPEMIVTRLMITLWTLGSFLHTVFDLGLWHMKACTLCRYGGVIDDRIARWGRIMGLFIVVCAFVAGSYAVLIRASIEYTGEGSESDEVRDSVKNHEVYVINFAQKMSFSFLLGYLVEFLLAMFVYYPLTMTVFFSGILGCKGRIPILGGRPREMMKEQRYEMNKASNDILKTLSLSGDDDDSMSTDSLSRSYRSDDFDYFDRDQII